MPDGTLRDSLRAAGVVPVVDGVAPEHAADLAGALADGGLPLMEITLRYDAALDAIAAASRARPDVLVGAGSLLDPAAVEGAVRAGAAFGVAPGFDPEVVAAAAAAGLPFVPGAATVSEVLAGLRSGAAVVKFFPARAAGGPAALRAIAAPLRTRDVALMPTGGIDVHSLPDYLAVPEVVAVGGSWLAPSADVTAGRWDAIRERAAAARTAVEEHRPA